MGSRDDWTMQRVEAPENTEIDEPSEFSDHLSIRFGLAL